MRMHRKHLTTGIGSALFGAAAFSFGLAAWAGNVPRDNTGDQTGTNTVPKQDAAVKKAGKKQTGKTPTQLGQVVVTAQSRTQEVEDVPIPLQIISAHQIETLAATDISHMDLFVPGLVVNAKQPTQPNYELRGISTNNFGVGTESAVGVYVDGVYAARSGGAYIDARYDHTITESGQDVSGQPTGAPRYSFATGMAYTWHHIADGNLEFDLEHGYRGASRCNADSRLQGTCQSSPVFKVGEARKRTDARLDWSSASGRWGAAMYVNNLFDHRYVGGVDNISASVFGTPFASITPPRTWGLELRAKY